MKSDGGFGAQGSDWAETCRTAALVAGATWPSREGPRAGNLIENGEDLEPTADVRVAADGISGTQIGTSLAHALNEQHLSDKQVEEVLDVEGWAMRGSNPRPRACEARALTS